MEQLKMTRWLVYGVLGLLALLGPRLFLIWHPAGVQTPAQSLLWAALSLLPFVVLFLAFRHDKRISRKRWGVFFLLAITAYLTIGPFGWQFPGFLEGSQHVPAWIERVVMAGGGWLLPLLLLVVFLTFVLLKHKRRTRS